MSQQSNCVSQSFYEKIEAIRQNKVEGIQGEQTCCLRCGPFKAASLWVIESIPIIGVLSSTLIYLLPWPWLPDRFVWLPLIAVCGGALFTIICWVTLSLFVQSFTNVKHINIESYQRLIDRLCQVAAWMETLRRVRASAPPEQSGSAQSSSTQQGTACLCQNITTSFINHGRDKNFDVSVIAVQEIAVFFCTIYDKLRDKYDIAWISGFGYLDVWRLMHRIDEAFVLIEPEEDVIYDALHDLRSIQNSKMDDEVNLISKLVNSIFLLDPCAARRYLDPSIAQHYLDPWAVQRHLGLWMTQHDLDQSVKQQPDAQPKTGQQANSATQSPENGEAHPSAANSSSTSGEAQPSACTAPQQALARTMIREVRFRLNQFRDSRWEKLIRVRLLMMKMTFWTGLVLYALLVFAILMRTNARILGLLAVYYLIGATVGLFGRLYTQSKMDVSLDDYHLADARLLALPLYSGLAAMLGIFLFSFLPALSSNNVTALGPTHDFASQFAFSPPNVLIASVFGLAPNLATSAIQAQADRYAGDIRSTSAQAKKE